MLKAEAQQSTKKLTSELVKLAPGTVLELYEIDTTNLGVDLSILSPREIAQDFGVFRFHNSIRLTSNSIFWQGFEYVAAPIQVTGFAFQSQGAQPTPQLSITVDDANIESLTRLKLQMYQLGDIVGAKVTRIRTFVKHLDAKNALENLVSDFEPDPNVEFPRDVFYIDRKSGENKNSIQYDLASLLDVEGVQLPFRLVLSNRCPFMYRGAGCHYEFASRATEVHGTATLPQSAPACANDKDELMTAITQKQSIIDRGEWQPNTSYFMGESVYITKAGRKYYFVSKEDNNQKSPTNLNYWVLDTCSKSLTGCKLRWGTEGTVTVGDSGLVKGQLPYGGFPAVNKLTE